jgi:cation diffusion facilitator family transporter
MYRYTVYHARKIGSDAFIADAWHHRSDAISSVGAFIGIGFSMLGFPVMDAVASIVIAAFILKVAGDIMKDAVGKMTDTSCGETFEKEIIALAEKSEDVIGIDHIQTRKFGSKVYIDLEIRVDGSKNLSDAHDIAENIHEAIETEFPEVKHVMIHVNPNELGLK